MESCDGSVAAGLLGMSIATKMHSDESSKQKLQTRGVSRCYQTAIAMYISLASKFIPVSLAVLSISAFSLKIELTRNRSRIWTSPDWNWRDVTAPGEELSWSTRFLRTTCPPRARRDPIHCEAERRSCHSCHSRDCPFLPIPPQRHPERDCVSRQQSSKKRKHSIPSSFTSELSSSSRQRCLVGISHLQHVA